MDSTKLIIVNKDDIREMTFNDIFEMYKPLIRNIVYSFHNLKLELDDKLQIASIGLWQAYDKYDIKTGTGFWALAKVTMDNSLRLEFNYASMKKRSGIDIISMYQPIDSSADGCNLVMDEIVCYNDIADEVIAKNHLNIFMSKLTDIQKHTLALVAMGKSYVEIADILGQTRPTISMRMTATRKIFNECMNIPKEPKKKGRPRKNG